MSWHRVAWAAGCLTVSALGVVVGKLWGASQEREAHEHLYEEHKNLRTEREALMSFFEERGYQYEKIVAEIYNFKPKNKAELRDMLTRYSLSEKEIERVNAMLIESDFYIVRAA